MASLGVSVANDMVNAVLDFYVREGTLAQTVQEKPLLKWIDRHKKPFPGGKQYISTPVRFAFIKDDYGTSIQGYRADDALTFLSGKNILRAQYQWYTMHSGLQIIWEELMEDGITVTDDHQTKNKPDADTIRIVKSVLKERMDDFAESYAWSKNRIYWQDGSQDAKVVPGILSILTDTPDAGTTGGLARATYTGWRHHAFVGGSAVQSSEVDQTLKKALQKDFIQLRRYGGMPNKAFAGSDFLDAIRNEVQSKGFLSMTGFKEKGQTNISVAPVVLDNTEFEYDPTLDDLGLSKRCYVMDGRRLRARPISGEEDKVLAPTRPYQYLVFLKSLTWGTAFECTQLNCHGVYEVK